MWQSCSLSFYACRWVNQLHTSTQIITMMVWECITGEHVMKEKINACCVIPSTINVYCLHTWASNDKLATIHDFFLVIILSKWLNKNVSFVEESHVANINFHLFIYMHSHTIVIIIMIMSVSMYIIGSLICN